MNDLTTRNVILFNQNKKMRKALLKAKGLLEKHRIPEAYIHLQFILNELEVVKK